MTINGIGKNPIEKVANLTINDVRTYLNGATVSDVQIQFAGDSDRISHQKLLSGGIIGIRHEKFPMFVPPTELSIIANNQPAMTVSTGVIQLPQVLRTPEMQEFITVTTLYNTGSNRTPLRVIMAFVYVSTPAASGSGTGDVSSCPIP